VGVSVVSTVDLLLVAVEVETGVEVVLGEVKIEETEELDVVSTLEDVVELVELDTVDSGGVFVRGSLRKPKSYSGSAGSESISS
jgi:hypothetical protein